MNVIRRVSAARKRKLRKLGERVWWCVLRESWVWNVLASDRECWTKRGLPW